MWRHLLAKDVDYHITLVSFESLARSLQEIQTRVQCCDNVDTHETPAFNSMQVENTVQQQEIVCDTVVQVEPCFLDWVNELSQVIGTMRAGKAIGVDSIPPEACRLAGKDHWCQLVGVAKQAVSTINFLKCGKVASCVVSQESQDSP